MPLLLLLLLLLAGPICAQSYPPEQVDIYLLTGQSNMAGRGAVGDIDTTVHPRVIALNAAGEWVPAREPLHFDKPGAAGVGPGLAFGKLMAAADTSRIIALVPAAVGGTSIDLWHAGAYDSVTDSHPYDDAIARARLAMKSGTLRGIIWHQGESDSRPGQTQGYGEKLRRVVEDFRRDLGSPNLPFVAGEQMSFKNNQPSRDITKATLQLTRDLDHYAVAAPLHETDKGDGTHLDAASARRFGEQYARKMQRLLQKVNHR